MKIFERLEEYRYEQAVFCHDTSTGLKAIICIHNTTLGPALGGCRMYPYADEEAAINDALRLARGMTYKAAASGLNLGGGKSVIIGDPHKDKSEALFRSFGRYIETLGGRYITAEDVGTTTEDMVNIQDKTYGGSGDPSPFTALGVFQGMKACAEDKFGSTSLEGKTVAVQGLGHVGYYLCELLHRDGVDLIVTDIRKENVERVVGEFGARAIEPDEIMSVECDVFAPCALGGILDDESIPKLRCAVIAGAANNVLLEPRHGESLAERGILYAPDYVINAGGLINVADELEGYNETRSTRRVMGIYESVKRIIAISKRDVAPPQTAADTLALERIDEMNSMVRLHTGHPYGQLKRQRETL
jgi:leucine dehydrogenase